MTLFTRLLAIFLCLPGLAGCAPPISPERPTRLACEVTEPLWIKPPEDSAVQDPPTYSYYFANGDQSLLASASWAVEDEHALNVSGEWIKIAWFRPAGADLVITGQRLDDDAPPLESEVGCCYPTRFQASSLYFPTEGCWRVTARAADSELSFTIRVAPKEEQPDSPSSSPPQ